MLHDRDYEPEDLQVKVSELLVATSDGSDSAIEQAVPEVLQLLRERMKMDVVFVSEFVDGQRVFRHVPPGQTTLPVGGGDPLEESWCQRVVDGRVPELVRDAATHPATRSLARAIPIGTHLSTPIVMEDGQIYGTLCCFSHGVNPTTSERDLQNLRYTAQLTARKIERDRAAKRAADAQKPTTRPQPKDVPDWRLQGNTRF
ncbi:MAG: GAF domain-containing protein [Burkholderiaceae bacterium]|nr:GAF domain-containing protein [Burkholderiaceae bacterium]